MQELDEWIAIIISLFSLCVSICTIIYNRKKVRCEITMKLLSDWCLNLNTNMTRSRKIVEGFNKEQCKNLYDNKKFIVSSEAYKEICIRMDKKLDDNCQEKELSDQEVNTLRDDVIKYLNLLETILAARQYNVADDKLIRNEFQYLVKAESGECVLSVFREATGDKNLFPAITKFCNDMNK